MKIMHLLGFFYLLLISWNVFSSEGDLYQSCDGSSDFNINFKKKHGEAVVAVSTNQIIIDAFYKENKKETTFYLEKPKFLGRGGMMLEWGSFDNSKPIFKLIKIKGGYNVKWYGFYNMKNKHFDFSMHNTEGDQPNWNMVKCNFK